MAATDEMVAIATRLRPHAACLVPEKREERTTEGGLDLVGGGERLAPVIAALARGGHPRLALRRAGARVMDAAHALGAPVVELHTGSLCRGVLAGRPRARRARTRPALRARPRHGAALGLEIHAGHGLTEENVGAVAAIPEIVELNIGHALIGAAIFVGLQDAVRAMRAPWMRGRAPDRAAEPAR